MFKPRGCDGYKNTNAHLFSGVAREVERKTEQRFGFLQLRASFQLRLPAQFLISIIGLRLCNLHTRCLAYVLSTRKQFLIGFSSIIQVRNPLLKPNST